PVAAAAVPADTAAESAAPAVALQLQMPDQVKVGEVFAVLVNVKSGLPLRGLPVQLEFPPQLLQVMDAEDGAFLRQDGVALSKTRTLEQALGHASMALLRHSADGVQGSGTVAAFRFRALAAGQAGISVVSARPVASVTVPPPALPPTGKVAIQ
ncbi:cohesin domain-containing protein, partial [Rugamonas aquatica]